MTAYKFLLPGAVGPFSGFRWPTPVGDAPGAWVDAGTGSACALGVHACAVGDLPFWLQVELWEVELAGETRRSARKVVAPRGRLVRRVAAWDAEAMRVFSQDCLRRLAELAETAPSVAGYLEDAEHHLGGPPAPVAYIAARAGELAGGTPAYEAERAAQARWLADRLGLEPAA